MAIDDRTVRYGRRIDPGKPEGGCLRFAAGRGLHRRVGLRLEEPVGTAVGEALELDHGLHHLETGDGDLAAEERPQRKREIERGDPRHVGGDRARRVGDAKVGGLDCGRRQDGDRERAVDRNLKTGDGLQALRDLGLEPLPIENRRHDEEGSYDEDQKDEYSVNEFHCWPCLGAG